MVFFWPACLWGTTETVNLPVTINYPFIRSMLIHQAYTHPGERAVLLDQDSGCSRIELWQPEVAPEGSLIRLGSNIRIRAGVSLLGKCTKLMEWEGYIEVVQQVWLEEKDLRLRFKTVDSRVYNINREPTTIARIMWHLIKTHLHDHLDRLSIDLAAPMKNLQAFLPLVFPPRERKRVETWLESMRLGQLRVEAGAVRLDISMKVETLPKPKEVGGGLTASEVEHLVKSWEDWDAFAVYEMRTFFGQPITESERVLLVETLLDTRQSFVRALSRKTPGGDLVREQFIRTWKKLSPIFRKYLTRKPSPSLLSYLSFLTSADALMVLDSLGPILGLDISRDGLLSLARMLKEGKGEPVLDYSYTVNPELRRLFGLGPPLDDSGPAIDDQDLDLGGEPKSKEKEGLIPGGKSLLNFWLLPAFAADAPAVNLAEIRPWVPPEKGIGQYLERVKEVLEQASENSLSRSQLDAKFHPLYRLLVLTTAWQESCWRQFVQSNGKVRYLLSHNQTSVGLMQVNGRVWRGIYRPESLCWNIHYNARAGSEIIDLYLRDAALKQMDIQKPLDLDTLARVLYAMYNGGPGEFHEFLRRKEKNSFYRSDRLFWQKYTLAKSGRFDRLSLCLMDH